MRFKNEYTNNEVEGGLLEETGLHHANIITI